MKTKINNIEQVTETGLLKALALKQFNNEDFFILGEKAYEGEENESLQAFEDSEYNKTQTFADFCENELVEIEPIEDDEERDNYIVLTDDEADEKAAEYIKDSLLGF